MREVNVLVDGVVRATCADEIDARYEGQHWYSEARRGGGKVFITYQARYVMPPNSLGIQEVLNLPLGSKEEQEQASLHDAAVAKYAAAMEAAKVAVATAASTGGGR